MQFTNKKIGELVAEDYRTADVFKKFGIDFCCGGGVTVSDICRKKNISESEVIDSLIKAVAGKDSGGVSDAKNWTPGFLADYIVRVHHSYVKESLPVLKEYSAKVEKVHGQGHE